MTASVRRSSTSTPHADANAEIAEAMDAHVQAEQAAEEDGGHGIGGTLVPAG